MENSSAPKRTLTWDLLETAKQYANTNPSAKFCLEQALSSTNVADTRMWAIKSLQYSVGIFHPILKNVNA